MEQPLLWAVGFPSPGAPLPLGRLTQCDTTGVGTCSDFFPHSLSGLGMPQLSDAQAQGHAPAE